MSKDLKKICFPKVFESIFKEYAKDLRAFVFFKTKDLATSEDIVQEAFLKLWNNCGNVDYNKVKSYLYTVCRNIFLNKVKHDNIVLKHSTSITKQEDNESPEFVLLEKEFHDKLVKAIEDLPVKQKQVFKMSRLEKKKYSEIALELNLSIKAVEKRMHLALKTLREKIEYL